MGPYIVKEFNCTHVNCSYIKREKAEISKGNMEMEISLGFIYLLQSLDFYFLIYHFYETNLYYIQLNWSLVFWKLCSALLLNSQQISNTHFATWTKENSDICFIVLWVEMNTSGNDLLWILHIFFYFKENDGNTFQMPS